MGLLCLLKGIFRSITCFKNVSGHDYLEIYNNKDISVLECELCKHISIGFYNK